MPRNKSEGVRGKVKGETPAKASPLPAGAKLSTSYAEPQGLGGALNPFGSIPTYEQEGLALFESGAIILHIAERWPGLLLSRSVGESA